MASEIKVDTISEKTSANGVTIDGVSLKDSKIATANSVDSDAYVDGSIDEVHMSANSIDSDSYVDGSIDAVHLSANSVDSDAYVDGSIDTVHIDALQVTGAKLNTDVISAQTELAAEPADTDEFMVSDAGVLKRIDYSLIKGGGGFTKVHSITASSSADITFDSTYMTATYKTYLVIADGIKAADDGPELQMYLSVDDGSNYLGSISRVHLSCEDDDAGITAAGNDEGAGACIIGKSSQGNDSGESGGGTIWIYGSQDANVWINVNCQYVSWGSGMELTWENSSHGARSTTALNNIKLQMSAGNISSGTFTLYGAN